MLEFGTTSTKSSGTATNIIVQPVTIADFNITYGEKREWQKYSDDIGIDLVLDVGQDFQPTMYIGGSFALDELNNTITGWGRAYKVKMFLDAIGLPVRLAKGTVVTENKLPDNAKELIVGMFLGIIPKFIFAAIEYAGATVGYQMGFFMRIFMPVNFLKLRS